MTFQPESIGKMESDSRAMLTASKRPRWGGGSLEATRLSLLTRLKDHADQDGWQRFFDTYGGVIRALAIQAGLSDADADEVLQDTLVSVSKEMPQFRYDPNRGSFKGWLFLIARRRIADHFRRQYRHNRLEQESLQEAAVEKLSDPKNDSLSQFWDEEWRIHHIQQAMDRVKRKVSPAQWQMFDLAAIQGWPTDKICTLLKVNRAQIYMARMRVGRLMKAELHSESTELGLL
jgi:RNA polymerase sigma-70 factor (ECF subfamily)